MAENVSPYPNHIQTENPPSSSLSKSGNFIDKNKTENVLFVKFLVMPKIPAYNRPRKRFWDD